MSLIGFLCALSFVGFSQDTIFAEPPPPLVIDEPFRLPGHRNPKVAGWLSTAIPGAGQIYNGQWWKVPIIYGGAGFLVYLHNFNRTYRNLYETEYLGRISGDTNFISDPFFDERRYQPDQLLSARNFYRRNLELVYIFSGLLYLLNIVDAVVFAHLATFDVSDNLTMRIEPFAMPDLSPFAANHRMPMQGGLRLTFTLK